MKILINRSPIHIPWGGGALSVNALYKSTDHTLIDPNTFSRVFPMNNQPDVFLIMGLDQEDVAPSAEEIILYKKLWLPQSKVFIRVNECDARKGTRGVDDRLLKLSEQVDGTIFVSKWMEKYFLDKNWACKNNSVIINGCNSEFFKHNEKLSKENEKINIVMHHWSDNKMKGQDAIEFLDWFVSKNPEFTFTFIGRTQVNLKNSKLIRPMTSKPLGEELGKYDVYISASRFDPGPNHIIEAVSCGLPTYVLSNGGGCVEFAGQDHTFKDLLELESLLLFKKFENNSSKFSSWENFSKQVFEFIGM